EAAAWSYLDEIESLGGPLAAIEKGFQQREIQEAAYRVQRAIDAGDQIVVGVNRFRTTRSARRRPRRSTPTASVARSSASDACGASARPRAGRPPWTSSSASRARRATSCPPS